MGEEAVRVLYRHEGLPYTGRIVGQRHDRTREQYWLRFIGKVAAAADAGDDSTEGVFALS